MILAGRRVVLGVSGGIAVYKSCTVARRLTEMGAEVDVVMTEAAAAFVGPVTFEALTRRPVLTSLWQPGQALAHVDLGRVADAIVVAPATANVLARAAGGIADDLLTSLLLATSLPVIAAPAMNDEMYAHPATGKNIAALVRRGWTMVGPAVGALAEGPSDRPGRMVEPDDIVAIVERAIRTRSSQLAGRRVVVTAGPTREEIDPVRVVTNRSSGRMGFALAAAAFARGAEVTLIAGPTSLPAPFGVRVVAIESTDDLRDAVAEAIPETDLLVMAAAPSDYRPDQRAAEKLPRRDGPLDLRLAPTEDVLGATAGLRPEGMLAVGFALETGDGVARARAKLERKALDLIVLNLANEEGAGFEVETNRVTLVTANDEMEIPVLPKREVAERILDAVERLA